MSGRVEQAEAWVQSMRDKGHTNDQIRQKLQGAGWRPEQLQALQGSFASARPQQDAAVQMYNTGVALHRKRRFREAMDAFDKCFRSGEYLMQSAYARGLCQNELGLEVEIPPELGDEPEVAGAVYSATNLACHLIAEGHRAALTKEGRTSEVLAEIEGSRYTIEISALFGAFSNWAWREEGQTRVSVPDPSENPNPTPSDQFVISLLEQASSLPLSPLPQNGLQTTL